MLIMNLGKNPGHTGTSQKNRVAFEKVKLDCSKGQSKDKLSERFTLSPIDAMLDRKELKKYVFKAEHLFLLFSIISSTLFLMYKVFGLF